MSDGTASIVVFFYVGSTGGCSTKSSDDGMFCTALGLVDDVIAAGLLVWKNRYRSVSSAAAATSPLLGVNILPETDCTPDLVPV